MNEDYKGPIFIVGLPRSGTKLIRSILNEHSKIFIPKIETEFLPYWVNQWEKFGDLSIIDNFDIFYNNISTLPYFTYQKEKDKLINKNEWYKSCKSFSLPGIFEALIRHDTNTVNRYDVLWGDKSPSYLVYIGLLKQLFPNAKVIHIIRDVRDYCLSMNKAWGKNMLRAAQRWSTEITIGRKQGFELGSDYFEIRYEDLLKNPESQCRSICDFLGVDFESKMLSLSKSPEKYGDTKGEKTIIRDNKNKYKIRIKTELLRKIELITFPILQSLGYSVTAHYENVVTLGKWKMLYYQILDGIQLFKFRSKELGLKKAILFQFQYFRITGNRYK